MSDRATTTALLERLERHYIKPDAQGYAGGVFIPECGVNGAWGAGSRADALYVGFTSASGRTLVGHEVKVSRADWRRELDKAGKADAWADNCHAWWIVAPHRDIVPVEELPYGWGLMLPSPRSVNRMKIEVPAIVHADRVPAWEATRSIMARLDTLTRQQLHDVRREANDKIHAEVERLDAIRAEQAQRAGLPADVQRRLAALDRLENLLGGPLDQHAWLNDDGPGIPPARAAAAMRLADAAAAANGQHGNGLPRHLADTLRHSAQAVLDGVDELAAAMAELATLAEVRR